MGLCNCLLKGIRGTVAFFFFIFLCGMPFSVSFSVYYALSHGGNALVDLKCYAIVALVWHGVGFAVGLVLGLYEYLAKNKCRWRGRCLEAEL